MVPDDGSGSGQKMVREYPEAFEAHEVGAAIAATRFGYGARPQELLQIGDQPREWLLGQMISAPIPEALKSLPDSKDLLSDMLAARQKGRSSMRVYRQEARKRALTEAATHLAVSLNSPTPFVERLVRFWTNHFTVSMVKPAVMPLVTAFEREAIRPNIFNSFYTMLHAVVSHPAMLIYLDNVNSLGPNSVAGRGRKNPLNDRLARQLLEHFTLGEGSGYTQLDVRALAHMLTGWTVGVNNPATRGEFAFRDSWHEGNFKEFLRRTIPSAGVLEGEAALDHLARSAATGKNLSHKMAQAFVVDDPDPGLASEIFAGFVVGGGRADGMARGLVEASEAWAPEQRKVKSPTDLVLSVLRSLDVRSRSGRRVLNAVRFLGQPPYQAPTPDGWPYSSLSWITPELLLERVEWCAEIAGITRPPDGKPVPDLALDILGPLLKPATHRRLRVARDEVEALALLYASPEFQRR